MKKSSPRLRVTRPSAPRPPARRSARGNPCCGGSVGGPMAPVFANPAHLALIGIGNPPGVGPVLGAPAVLPSATAVPVGVPVASMLPTAGPTSPAAAGAAVRRNAALALVGIPAGALANPLDADWRELARASIQGDAMAFERLAQTAARAPSAAVYSLIEQVWGHAVNSYGAAKRESEALLNAVGFFSPWTFEKARAYEEHAALAGHWIGIQRRAEQALNQVWGSMPQQEKLVYTLGVTRPEHHTLVRDSYAAQGVFANAPSALFAHTEACSTCARARVAMSRAQPLGLEAYRHEASRMCPVGQQLLRQEYPGLLPEQHPNPDVDLRLLAQAAAQGDAAALARLLASAQRAPSPEVIALLRELERHLRDQMHGAYNRTGDAYAPDVLHWGGMAADTFGVLVLVGGLGPSADGLPRQPNHAGLVGAIVTGLASGVASGVTGVWAANQAQRGRQSNPRPISDRTADISESAKIPGFDKNLAAYEQFHGVQWKGRKVRVVRYEDGKKKVTRRVVAALGTVPETVYQVPFNPKSNKAKATWVHKHPRGSEPTEVLDALSGVTSKIGGSSKVTDWWHD